MSHPLNAERFADDALGGIPLGRLRAFLGRDPFATAYMLGDLDPVYASFCTWWIASEAAAQPRPGAGPHEAASPRDVAVLLVYTGLSAPVVLTHGSAAGIQAILAQAGDELPQRAHVHMSPDHLAVIDQHFTLDRLRPMVRMGLRAADVSAKAAQPQGLALPVAPVQGYGPVERLGHRHTGDIMALSQHYPDSFFEPHQLSSGHYYGIFAATSAPAGSDASPLLVAVAGVHIVSKSDRVAALGNIVTHPDHRGKGLSTVATMHLCRELAAEGIELLALNVERRNTSALRVYEKLGFVDHCTYIEAFMTRTLDRQLSRGA
ncbi:MAG: GNAT family N-acetyltransferase [Deltaproteobacteria bacterium]|nr:GNAT family N-acetyltransferase [Deltaproteobacteria bacterium]